MSIDDHRIPGSRLTGALAASVMGSYVLPALAIHWPALRRSLGVENHTRSATGYALTFDDGPHPQGTPATLELLAQADVRATFFLVGEQVARNRALALEIQSAGHTIGLHCHRHRNLLRLAPWQVRDDIDRAQTIIQEVTGRAIELYRPPYGVLNAQAVRLARQRDWRMMLWSHWGRDWERRATAESITQRLTKNLRAGSVLLLHDADDYSAPGSWRQTVAALPRVIQCLGEAGLAQVAL